MYLIDSSAWIEYLRPDGSQYVKTRVKEVLTKEDVITCGIVVIEIMRGARDRNDFNVLSGALNSLPRIPIDDAVIDRAAHWGYMLDREGKVIPTTDLLIASASFNKAVLLHVDTHFRLIASRVGIIEEMLR
ncbi:MAG: PIN domain-containing protein [Nitrospirae bacterium]|nr:PIN domain-containing protein [Nitrospirota bacterium]